MATGDFPFHGDSSGALETSVLEDIPKIPSYVSWNTEALIDKLLCKDPHYRLGLDKEIFRQPLFQDTDWDAVVAHAVPPPFPPEIKEINTCNNTIKVISSEESLGKPITSKEQRKFQGFSFKNPEYQ
ncbi:protein kinase C delta type [Xenopus laevis]|uniref:Protein kinase C delta type n=1 Tax=Xenopus laevis TaxID=8355 RepID=A0A8J0TYB3_XENLA|nr:protein kinase C delta type [Xenopus laevis]